MFIYVLSVFVVSSISPSSLGDELVNAQRWLSTLWGDLQMVKGRCMKCKAEVEMKNPKDTIMKNGMKAAKGECPKCGTKVFRIIGKA
jgi:DNA-directed RNA polymerase subunit RPC12/RpoP